MQDESVARRYAAAVFAFASEKAEAVALRNELQSVVNAIDESPELKQMLHHPLLTEARKKEALEGMFGKSFSADTLSFLKLLIDKRRINSLPSIIEEFTRLVRAEQNIEFATATSAVSLTPSETAALEKSLEARTGMDIELKTEVDPSLIGGILVRIGDTVFDGSVKGNLERLREHLLASR